ncbi:MAG: DUF5103 domain-containing protein [Dysgonomonas sp.]
MKYIKYILFMFCFCVPAKSQIYKTQALNSNIGTIQINKNGDWLEYPVIELNSSEYIQLNFDRISDNSYKRLRYKLIHCNADWTQSSLSTIEFLDGFDDNLIDDYAISEQTTVDYTNYILQIPNKDINLKLSGNYVIEVVEDDTPDKILLTACFSVLDKQSNIAASVSSNTDIDSNKEHQQVSFSLSYGGIDVRDPYTEIKTYVRQNNRLDNEKALVKPTFIQPQKLLYDHNRDLIFEAGNEYRRFESLSYKYNGLNIERTEFINPYYYTSVIPDKIRAGKLYDYDQDQNGRFYIRNGEVSEENYDTQADYFKTTFTLKTDNPFLESIYINGAFSNDSFSDKYKMTYDNENKQYTLTLSLKQGAYNYQYLTKNGNTYSAKMIEGNHFETENEYTIMVYFRPVGQRYDSLIGFSKIIYK